MSGREEDEGERRKSAEAAGQEEKGKQEHEGE